MYSSSKFALMTVFVILTTVHVQVESANILFFFGISSYSHRIGVWPLTEELAERGHKVTFLSPYAAKKPNPKIHDFVPKSLKAWVDSWNETATFYDLRRNRLLDYEWYKIEQYGIGQCQVLMDDPDFLKWTDEAHFDLVIVDALCNECAYGLAHKFKAKIIVFNTANPFTWYVDPFGFPDESSSVPDMVLHFPPKGMTFYQRFLTLMNPIYFNYIREIKYFPELERMMREKLAKDLPGISELERNVSLMFVNHHYAEDYAKPLPPNIIPVSGLHITNDKQKLPKDLEAFLQKGGTSGFLYMSFGSYSEISHFPKHIQDAFTNTLKKLKNIQVIWKTDMPRPKDLPDHIYTGKWMPQQTILAHPNIKGFITHGGLLGIQEAIVNAVPLVAFPIFAEQDYNADKVEDKEIGIQLEISSVTEDQFMGAIQKLLSDSKYKTNMKKISKKFTDRPISALDTAVWWTEYVLRNDDTSELRPLSIYQPWWKKRQLDIWAAIFMCIIIALKLGFIIIKLMLGLFSPKSTSGAKKAKQS